MNAADIAGELVVSLVAHGVRHIVACPGSRNSPLLLAAHQAHQQGLLSLHMRLDERAAAWTALGIARASHQPSCVVVTSGTAVGNLLPAVMEARHSHHRLICVSADRPAHLRGTGANQTTTHTGLFAPAAPETIETGSTPEAIDDAVAEACRGGVPGPRHLNVVLEPPLTEPPKRLVPRVDVPVPPALQTTIETRGGAGTIIVAGDASPAWGALAAALAQQHHLPLLGEPSSNARVDEALSTGRLLLSLGFAGSVTRVILFGRATLSRPQWQLLSSPDVHVHHVAEPGTDEHPPATVATGTDVRILGAPDPEWKHLWGQADAWVRRDLDAEREWSGRRLAATILAHTPAHHHLVWGPSQLLRDADLAPIVAHPPVCHSNRGLSGIDGVLSTAQGISLGAGRPTTAVVGDLTALHDIGSLAVPRWETAPDLRIIVANDDGGAIFSTLEQRELDHDPFERLFGVPHGLSPARIAAGFGIPSDTLRSQRELEQRLAEPVRGLSLWEVPLSRRGTSRADPVLDKDLRSRVGTLATQARHRVAHGGQLA